MFWNGPHPGNRRTLKAMDDEKVKPSTKKKYMKTAKKFFGKTLLKKWQLKQTEKKATASAAGVEQSLSPLPPPPYPPPAASDGGLQLGATSTGSNGLEWSVW